MVLVPRIAYDPKVKSKDGKIDFVLLAKTVATQIRMLDNVIDLNFYPTKETEVSNMRHRPIGIGVQGLADAFILMDIAFHSEEAKVVNKRIFETIYYASMEMSNKIAQEIAQEERTKSK